MKAYLIGAAIALAACLLVVWASRPAQPPCAAPAAILL